MSDTQRGSVSVPETGAEGFTDDERELFAELADDFEDDPVGDIFEAVLQSSSESSEEGTTS